MSSNDILIDTESVNKQIPPALPPEVIQKLQDDLNNTISRFFESTNEIGMEYMYSMPICIGMMLHLPWHWIVDEFKRTPEDFAKAIQQEVNVIVNTYNSFATQNNVEEEVTVQETEQTIENE
jgi:hypothetical protein